MSRGECDLSELASTYRCEVIAFPRDTEWQLDEGRRADGAHPHHSSLMRACCCGNLQRDATAESQRG